MGALRQARMLDRRNERKALVRSLTIHCLKMGFCFLTSSTQKIKTASTSRMRTLSQAKRKKKHRYKRTKILTPLKLITSSTLEKDNCQFLKCILEHVAHEK